MSRFRTSAHTAIGGRARLGAGETWRDAFDNRPPWADGVLLRRILAALCALAAVTLFLRGDPAHARSTVVVAARDLPPGHLLGAADLRLASYPPDVAPDGAAADPAPLLGAVLTAALRAGEVLTDVRVVGPRLAEVATGRPDSRIVPVRLADTAITEILRAGDRVDVVAAGSEDPTLAQTLAVDAAVVLVSGPPEDSGAHRHAERVVLVAMDARRAAVVAAASLNSALTVIFH
ncbi:SAF domain-containing protein [Nocardia sp. NBC_01329]|uniref:SAF domain-containing protein n=1 Tax=Nocardia sp. NBC_01329 TaxID=2903594 RepID=UPI002E1003F3|nr:SAF domain-containing protein [Nocardia sp. NBC_01329]